MRNCPYCKIEVGGDLRKCPLCQSKLLGEGDAAYFPRQTVIPINSFFYRLQLFIIWVLVIAGFGIDFLFKVKIGPFENLHWSLILAMWLIIGEYWLITLFKKGTSSSRTVTMMSLTIGVMLLITSYFFGFFDLTVDWIIPIALTGTIIANFVLAMVDRKGNAMAYLLCNILVGALPYIVIHFRNRDSIPWMICLMVSIILFVGAVIFKGKTVAGEIRRRLNV